MAKSTLAELVALFRADPHLAQQVLFAHRHPNAQPDFHARIIKAWASAHPRVLIEAFRGAAKSTIAEEFLACATLFGEEPFALIVGNTYDAACSRLASIKRELDYNPHLEAMFGNVRGDTWNENEITLSVGGKIMAYGRGQSLRGAKDERTNRRPTLVLIDDLEDADSVATPEAREKAWRWLTRELLPALDPHSRVRVNGTPLHEDSIIERLKNSAQWQSLSFPLYTPGPQGEIVPTWPDRFPARFITELREQYERDGDLAGFSQEYLCKPIDSHARTFHEQYLRVVDVPPSWAPRQMAVDPARTVKSTSSRTGYVVFSWAGSQLVVHEAIGAHHTPFDQVAKIWELHAAHQPMTVGIESNGLEEWLMQPLRAEMTRRGELLPIQELRAPKDKRGFIAGLEPFFRAGEVVFAKPLPDLKMELLSFPFGKLDVVNALAYALKMRPGAPLYPRFGPHNVSHQVVNARGHLVLALNGQANALCATLMLFQDGQCCVLRDWVREGPIGENLRRTLMDVAAWCREHANGNNPALLIPADRDSTTDASGLVNELRRCNIRYTVGPRIAEARGILESALLNQASGPSFTVAPEATWTLNALSGGYARSTENGSVSSAPTQNIHALVASSAEISWKALLSQHNSLYDDDSLVYSTTSSGRRYISMRR